MNRNAIAILGLLLVLAAGPASARDDGIRLPDIGASAGAVVSEQAEEAYGEALLREFRRLARTVDDPLIEDYVRHLGYTLVSFSDRPDRAFHFVVVEDDRINAFAAPGGFVGIHSGLMLTAETESELAGVLAHEIAHVTQRHIARAIESRQRMSLPMTLLMLGVMLAGAGEGGDAVPGALMSTQALMQQMQIDFTRANEYEADRVGIGKLAAAGFDPDGMADFFARMARATRSYGSQIPEFLRTHPVTSTRIAEAKNRARQVERSTLVRDPSGFLVLRERLRVLTADRPQDMVRYYRQVGIDEFWSAYGLALAQVLAGDPVGAAETIAGRQGEAGGDHLAVALLEAEIDFAAGRGFGRYETLNERYPEHRAVARAFGEALLETPGPESARRAERLLRPLLLRYPEDGTLFARYARAADRAGLAVRAKEAFAQHVFLQGRVYDAVAQLRTLLDGDELDYYERSRIEARLAEMEPILAEIERNDGYDPSEGDRERGVAQRLALDDRVGPRREP